MSRSVFDVEVQVTVDDAALDAPVSTSIGHRQRFADAKRDLLQRAADVARVNAHTASIGGRPVLEILEMFYAHVAYEDLAGRDPFDIAGPVLAFVPDVAERTVGHCLIDVASPSSATTGWRSPHTVVRIVTDDMPFLVDSVTADLAREGRAIHLVVHPLFRVLRDPMGALIKILGPDEQDPAAVTESWIHVEVDRETDADDLVAIEENLRSALTDVREAVEDWQRMQRRALELADEIDHDSLPVGPDEVQEASSLLRWLVDDNFTFLGYREYRLVGEGPDEVLEAVPATGLGVLRSDARHTRPLADLTPEVRAKVKQPRLLVLTKANSRSTVHRPAYLDYIGIKRFDQDGRVVGERRFLGLFTAAAYTQSVRAIPFLQRKLASVLAASGFSASSHNGRDLVQFIETYPRDELFTAPVEDLLDVALQVQNMQERRQVRLFLRRDEYSRYVSCLVYLPRDRYSTQVRKAIEAILMASLDGASIDFTARVSESVLARLHFVVRLERGRSIPDVDVDDLETRIADATRTWSDDLGDAVVEALGEEQGAHLVKQYSDAFPESYKEEVPPRMAVEDLRHIEALAPGELGLNLYEPFGGSHDERRLKIYRRGSSVSLSVALPVLQRMGADVTDERPYIVSPSEGEPVWIHDFGFRFQSPPTGPVHDETLKERFEETIHAVWYGEAESDGFNALVLRAGMTWRQAAVVRAYARYLRQTGSTFSLEYMEQAVVSNLSITQRMIEQFMVRFDPDHQGDRAADSAAIGQLARMMLDEVASLDQDRILRAMLALVEATTRTNWFQVDSTGRPAEYTSFKFDPSLVPELPLPRPRHEIWVYAPRVEGVHLRMGAVARGGLRWSDRREDFRTEILGLVKAQAVKNAVIVPNGAKGGFVVKDLPDPSDREAFMAAGIEGYSTFIKGLLDLTDNYGPARTIIPPTRVVRHDGDDPYLVVAADKGTASFSDIANGIAIERGFWLGDAFASGGSAGYDHKEMGITARGAWESVKRHFRELGVDVQNQDITVVGIGDMSGDVFGNGMLLSRHLRIVAAFDHRHVFIDPNPDAAVSFQERERLFALPRSSWADYDAALISEGGGVFPRTAKSIAITEQMRTVLDLPAEVTQLTPAELIKRCLLAPVDLLWNGGIGTYVKARGESHLDVGDKTNDALRVDGHQLRCAVVGEGGNLGFTQCGRIEAARHGVLINTDAIDNSAGVDTSDHEVNIKILLDFIVREGDLTEKQRDALLDSMTDEVAALVLRDNYEQNVLLGNARVQASSLLSVHQRLLRELEHRGRLDRVVEFLPNDEQLAELAAAGGGLTSPEFAVLAAYSKMTLVDDLEESDVPDDPWFQQLLGAYFPQQVRDQYADRLAEHALRREIVTTVLGNDIVNRGGITFVFRAQEETSADPASVARAYSVSREVFGMAEIWHEIEALDGTVPTLAQSALFLEARRLLDRSTRWFLQNRSGALDIGAEVARFGPGVAQLAPTIPDLLVGAERDRLDRRTAELVAVGAPEATARRVAALLDVFGLLDICQVAQAHDADLSETAQVYFTLSARYEIDRLLLRVTALPRADRWSALARFALRYDLYTALAGMTDRVLATTDHGSAEERIAAWESGSAQAQARTRAVLEEVAANDSTDIAPVSVALRVLRNLVRSS
jgi:glutamate dehydrogenase